MRRFLIPLAITVLLFTSVIAQANEKVAELESMGPYEVGFTYFMLVDDTRNTDSGFGGRPVPIALFYPVDPEELDGTPKAIYPFDPYGAVTPTIPSTSLENYGIDGAYQDPPVSSDAPFPLVVFSPGWGAHYFFHISVGTRLASHGFVVAVLSHYGDGATPSDSYHHISMASLVRTQDIPFALDHLLAANGDPSNELFGLIRPDQIAASGWSLGGYGAMALAGGDDEVCDMFWFTLDDGLPPDPAACVPAYPDPRIKVILPLDGSNQGLHFQELARIQIPTIGIGQSWESVWDWQARQHAAIQGHPTYRVDLAGSNHITFSDACVVFPILADEGILDPDWVDWWTGNACDPFIPFPLAHQLVRKYMLAFLKIHLVGESGYQKMLTPGWALKHEPMIEFFVTEKKNPSAIPDDIDWPEPSIYFPDQPGSKNSNAFKGLETSFGIPYMGLWW